VLCALLFGLQSELERMARKERRDIEAANKVESGFLNFNRTSALDRYPPHPCAQPKAVGDCTLQVGGGVAETSEWAETLAPQFLRALCVRGHSYTPPRIPCGV
jgi:hypothetical protein